MNVTNIGEIFIYYWYSTTNIVWKSTSFDRILEWIKSFAIFWYMLVCGVYITWLEQFKPLWVHAVVGNIVIVGALTQYALLHFVVNLKAAEMKVKCSREFRLYEFELGYNQKNKKKKNKKQTNIKNVRNPMVEEISLGSQEPQRTIK